MKAYGEWKAGDYGFHRLYLPHGLQIVLGWDAIGGQGGYKVSSFGVTLKARPKDLNEAKALGVKLARKLLVDALGALPNE